MIGIDIVEPARLLDLYKFSKKVLSVEELEVYNELSIKQKRLFLAGRFAGKEALYKATGTTLKMTEVSILNDDKGKPYFLSHPYWEISISHEKSVVVAVVIDKRAFS